MIEGENKHRGGFAGDDGPRTTDGGRHRRPSSPEQASALPVAAGDVGKAALYLVGSGEQQRSPGEILDAVLATGAGSTRVTTRLPQSNQTVYRSGRQDAAGTRPRVTVNLHDGFNVFGAGVGERESDSGSSWQRVFDREAEYPQIDPPLPTLSAEMIVFSPATSESDSGQPATDLCCISYAFGAIPNAHPARQELEYQDPMGRPGNKLIAEVQVPWQLAEEFYGAVMEQPKLGRAFGEAAFRQSVPPETQSLWQPAGFGRTGVEPPYHDLAPDHCLSVVEMSSGDAIGGITNVPMNY